jgi:hypothetical protein
MGPALPRTVDDLIISVWNRVMRQPWRFRAEERHVGIDTNRAHVRLAEADVRRLHLWLTARVRELDGG